LICSAIDIPVESETLSDISRSELNELSLRSTTSDLPGTPSGAATIPAFKSELLTELEIPPRPLPIGVDKYESAMRPDIETGAGFGKLSISQV
jgi:hypothetical protein